MEWCGMASEPDLIGTTFFTVCAIFLLCLTLWPRLWVAISFNRRWATEEFGRKAKLLPLLTGFGALLSACSALAMYLGA
jgi:hypothetical protein